jgi:hypothetical protein
VSYRPEVKVHPDNEKWCSNALRFATEAEAFENARALAGRWLLVTDWRAAPSDDPVNYRWVDGQLEPVEVSS